MRVEISKRLVAVNAGSAVFTKAINVGVLIWLQQHLLHRISPEEYALYPPLMAIMMCVPLLTGILTSGLGRYIVEACAQGDEKRVTSIVSTMLPPLGAAGLVVLACGWIMAWNVDRVLHIAPGQVPEARLMLALLMFSAAIGLPAAALTVGLYVRQKFVLHNAMTLAAELFRLALLFALLFGVSTRVCWVVLSSVAANLGMVVAMALISRRLVPALRFRRDAIHWPLLRQLTTFGTWNFLAQATYVIRDAADPLILNRWGTALDVTCFHLGTLPYRQIQQSVGLATAPLQPPMTAMHATGDKSKLGRTYLRSNRYGMWIALAVAVPLVIFRRELITLYVGREFLAAAAVMAFTLAVLPVSYANLMLPSLAVATAQMRRLTVYALITHAANLLLSLYLVCALNLGATGVAVAYLITGLTCWPLYVSLGMRLAEVTFRQWLYETVWLGILPGLAGGGLLIVLKFVVQPDTWLLLGLCTAAGGLLYLGVLLRFGLNGSEYADLRRMWNRLQSIAFGVARTAPV